MKTIFSGAVPMTTLRTSRSASIDVLEIDEDHVKGAYKNVLLMVWAKRTLADAYRRAISIVHEMRVDHPQGVCLFHVVEDTAVPPDTDAREAFTDLLKTEGVKQFSVVFEASGFKAAAVRAIVQAGQALVRPKFPHSVHQSVAASAAWHAGLSREHSAAELQEAVQLLRELHRSRYPV